MSSVTRQVGRNQPRPWGRAAGLLTACVITLTGVIRGFSPEVILSRAACGGLVIGLVVWAAAAWASYLKQRS